jgi:hypothetical protein
MIKSDPFSPFVESFIDSVDIVSTCEISFDDLTEDESDVTLADACGSGLIASLLEQPNRRSARNKFLNDHLNMLTNFFNVD